MYQLGWILHCQLSLAVWPFVAFCHSLLLLHKEASLMRGELPILGKATHPEAGLRHAGAPRPCILFLAHTFVRICLCISQGSLKKPNGRQDNLLDMGLIRWADRMQSRQPAMAVSCQRGQESGSSSVTRLDAQEFQSCTEGPRVPGEPGLGLCWNPEAGSDTGLSSRLSGLASEGEAKQAASKASFFQVIFSGLPAEGAVQI